MQSWKSPDVRSLPGPGIVPRVFDHSTGQLVSSAGPGSGSPRPDVGRIYVCGITPYDATHLGHAATYLVFDVLQRCWLDAGLTRHYVQNVTDVDDPLLERANATGVSWRDLASREIDAFREDMASMQVLAPHEFVGVVDSMQLVIALIERLQAAGAVYQLDRDLYFSVRTAGSFGAVSHLPEAQMLALSAERGGDPDRPGKRDRLDSLVWQAERPGEPAWDSPFGRGRPGWHVECTAIALEHLGPHFDVQGGGSDLVFPHHEMCAAQGELAAGGFAHAYSHQAMVRLAGEKMSKSQGNLVFVAKLRADGVDPAAIRLTALDHHYRTEWDWTDDVLGTAQQRLARWRAAGNVRLRVDGPLQAVRTALADDLNTPAALAALDDAAAAAERRATSLDDAAPTLAEVADALLGVAV
jgi:L-cysteine:1D-myo-inositol 2-amino-2-deoxy-alpha-D-glucopyranoside ligase